MQNNHFKILCYASNLVTFKQIQQGVEGANDDTLIQVHSLLEMQNGLKNQTVDVIILHTDDEQLPVLEVLDALAQSDSKAGVITFSETRTRLENAQQFAQGICDSVCSNEITLLNFIVQREVQAAKIRAGQDLSTASTAQTAPSMQTPPSAPTKPSVQVSEEVTENATSHQSVSQPKPEPVQATQAPPVAPQKPAKYVPPPMSDSELAEMLEQLKQALQENKFQMLFQPLIQLGGDDTEFYEVLLRLPKDDGSLISAGLFMNAPQVPDEIKNSIDRWVIKKAIKLLADHLAKGSKTRMFINLCASSLTDSSLADDIKSMMQEKDLPKESIIFQFNEEDASEIIAEASAFSASLNNHLMPVSLSRFGMQPESMALCHKINPLFVKLNGYFSKNINQDANLKTSTEQLLNQLKKDYKIIIMPMVEDVATVSTLWKMGTDFVQGFYVQAPVSGVSFDFDDD